jgi:opacity protein-like surface antigen
MIAASASAGSAVRAQGSSSTGALADGDSAQARPAPAATGSLAQSAPATSARTGSPRATGRAVPAHAAGFRPHLVWTLRLGNYDPPEREGQLVQADLPLTFAAACGYQFSPHLEVGGEGTGFGAIYDGPHLPDSPNGSFSDERPLSNWGLGATARGLYPLRWFKPYAEVGVGYSTTTVSADVNEYVGFWPFIFSKKVGTRDVTVSGLAPHVALGADLSVSKHVPIGAEYRRMWLRGDFGALSNGEVVVAESFYSVVIRTTRLGPP